MMRLINIDTLELESFTDQTEAPPYAILSHTWDSGEVSLQDVVALPRGELESRRGWVKVTAFCEIVRKNRGGMLERGLRYGWVDTCCIDKTSSAELSEAINSMFQWYRQATVCFVFLADVDGAAQGQNAVGDDFERSRWFTRGWTLQELLAPRDLYFFDRKWESIGDKFGLAERVSQRTKIDLDAILTGSWDYASISERMSWAAHRKTTRKEDTAYCLLGVFDVNIPLLYGEGGDKAFIRLQEEIMRQSADQSILAWDASTKDESMRIIGALATHPFQFRDGANIEVIPSDEGPATLTQKGIQINLPIVNLDQELEGVDYVTLAVLDCRYVNDLSSRVGIPVRTNYNPHIAHALSSKFVKAQHVRTRAALVPIPLQGSFYPSPVIFLEKRDQKGPSEDPRLRRCWVRFWELGGKLQPVVAVPTERWHISRTRTMTMLLPRRDDLVEAAVAFRLDGSLDVQYGMALRLFPTKGSGMVRFRALEKSSESLEVQLAKLAENAESTANWEETEVRLGPKTIVSIETYKSFDDPSIFNVALSFKH